MTSAIHWQSRRHSADRRLGRRRPEIRDDHADLRTARSTATRRSSSCSRPTFRSTSSRPTISSPPTTSWWSPPPIRTTASSTSSTPAPRRRNMPSAVGTAAEGPDAVQLRLLSRRRAGRRRIFLPLDPEDQRRRLAVLLLRHRRRHRALHRASRRTWSNRRDDALQDVDEKLGGIDVCSASTACCAGSMRATGRCCADFPNSTARTMSSASAPMANSTGRCI